MTEYDDQWLRDELAAAVPPPPEVADRAQRATAKARRGRQLRAAGVLGAAAVVVAAAVAWNVSGDGSDRADDPAGPTATTCPEPDPGGVDSSKATGKAGDGLPPGATSARLCLGPGNPFDVPLDALVTGVDDLIATINGLEPHPTSGPDQACTLELGTGYQIVFGYPDGSTSLVSGQPYGCAAVAIGADDFRTEPLLPRDRFVALLRKQRDAAEPPATAPASDLHCQGALGMSPVGRAADITEAVYCADGPGPAIPIPVEDLAVLVADMQTSALIGVTTACFTPGRIVGQTAWGDTVQTSALCGGDRWGMEDDLAWQVSPASKAILDRLAASAG